MRTLLLLAVVASVAGCEQPEGAPTTNGGQNLAGSQVADGTWGNVSDDPRASAPETSADPGANEASPASDPGDPIAAAEEDPTAPVVKDPCTKLQFEPCYTTKKQNGFASVSLTPDGDLCRLKVEGYAAGSYDGSEYYGTDLPAEGGGDEWVDNTLEAIEIENSVVKSFALRQYYAGTNDIYGERILVAVPPASKCHY